MSTNQQPEPSTYQGTELEVFSQAIVWKSYFRRMIRPFLGPRVLEVGAGIGGTTAVFAEDVRESWVCLEPDPAQVEIVEGEIRAGRLPGGVSCRVGTLSALDSAERFDTILYIDVLEHIEDDRGEALAASRHLEPGGHLVILSPAHQGLFCVMDVALGHFRRYSRATLRAAMPEHLELVSLRYLDAVGLLASLANRWLLSQAQVTYRQMWTWDRFLVRASRWVDPLTMYRVGKSVLGVWRRPLENADPSGRV